VCVITGAGSGLGRALAVRLAALDWRLVLVGRREDRLIDTRQMCAAAAGAGDGAGDKACLVVAADLTDRAAAGRVVQAARDTHGRIDALVNNAALARFAPLDVADLDTLDLVLRTNLVAPAALIKHALPDLRRSRGQIVNVGSIGGVLALPGRSFDGASKAAVHHLTRSLARELAPEIRVNAVVPGAIDTEMYDELGLEPAQRRALRAELVNSTPLRRMGTTAEVVPWIELLLGPAGGWMTGSLLVVDGGRSC
jgi:NAD(P)-dependent dehydrogenase (short-subunit alcohol dehydrogenase family)